MQINLGSKRIHCKIVYYGPGYCGKTTNIQRVHDQMPVERRSDLTSIATEGDRTLFFDFMSLDLGQVMGMDTCFQLYTVPGQVYYNATRKLVLQGVDGLVFVADSSPDRMDANAESWHNLEENLKEYGLSLQELPIVIQFNKRDVSGALPVEELNRRINSIGAPTFEAVASQGEGVLPTLKGVCSTVLKSINRRVGLDKQRRAEGMRAAQAGGTPSKSSETAVAVIEAPPVEPKSPTRQSPDVRDAGAPESARAAAAVTETTPTARFQRIATIDLSARQKSQSAPGTVPGPRTPSQSQSGVPTKWMIVAGVAVAGILAAAIYWFLR